MKMPKFGTKNVLFGYFWARILKNYSHIWNQHSRTCYIFICYYLLFIFFQYSQICYYLELLIAKICKKAKMPIFGTKNALFGYFLAGIWKRYCHIWNPHPQICLIAKFCEKMKFHKFGTKNVLFEYF